MAGEAPLGAPVTDSKEAEALARRIALVRIVAGVPTLIICLFAVVLAYRLSGRPMGDPAFWLVLAGIVLGFGAYLGHAAWRWKNIGRYPAPNGGRDASPPRSDNPLL